MGEQEAEIKPAKSVQDWLKLISESAKREKDWRKDARSVIKQYEAEDKTKTSYNILYSNTCTTLPALYNKLPRPSVARRFKDNDQLGKEAARVAQRGLEFFLDTGNPAEGDVHDYFKRSVLQALVAGRGLLRLKYEADIMEGELPKVASEYVCAEYVAWDRLYIGYAEVWESVPWLAFEHRMTRAEVVENFGKKDYGKLKFTARSTGPNEEEGSGASANEAEPDLAVIYEIWDKQSKQVSFIADGLDEPLKAANDPYGLQSFFPVARPIMFFYRVSGMTPTTLYAFYKTQADELTEVSVRITKIVKALKVRGFYDSTVGGLSQIFEQEDNVLIPAENVAALQDGKTLENSIYLMPIDKLVGVLQQLYVQREQVKQVIYEITGISDIIRGSTVASETATAQEIKNQWGTLRLKDAQAEVQRFVRDTLRIVAELMATKLSPETWRAMTGLQYPTAQEKQQLQLQMQMAQQSGQQVEPPPGLNSPSWEEIIGLLQQDTLRNYRIDIELNSTVDSEATEDKQDMGEMLNAVAQFMNGVGPMVEQGIFPFEAAKAMLLGVVRKFRFGSDAEDAINSMKPPQPKDENTAEKQKLEGDLQLQQLKMQEAQQKADLEKQRVQLELEALKAEHALKMEELQLKAEAMKLKFQQDIVLKQTPAAPEPREEQEHASV